MKVFNLRCRENHRFEGWFHSNEEFEHQVATGLARCPMCDCPEVSRVPAAPRLNLGGESESVSVMQGNGAWLKALRALIKNTENVGERFVSEARKIHYHEAPERPIRGIASEEQRRELLDEGIEVFVVPLPAAVKEPLQ